MCCRYGGGRGTYSVGSESRFNLATHDGAAKTDSRVLCNLRVLFGVLQHINDIDSLDFSCLVLDPVKGSVLDQGDPLVPAIDVDQGSSGVGLAVRQTRMLADMIVYDTCFSVHVDGSVFCSSWRCYNRTVMASPGLDRISY